MPPKAKPGEGIVIVVDVGPNVRASTETTFYSQSKECLINILQRKIFADKCRDMVGIVLFGTDETKNNLATDDQYQHITVMQEPKYVDWDLVARAENLPRGNSHGDWLDAVVVAMDLLHDGDDLGAQKLVLITDFNSDFTADQLDFIISGMQQMEIEFTVIGPSLDDDVEEDDVDSAGPSMYKGGTTSTKKGMAPLSWNGKPKTTRQMAAESLVKTIVAKVDGVICSFDEAVSQLIFFEKKSQGSANWNAMLDIGTEFRIPVVGNIKIKRATETNWKKEYAERSGTEAVIAETLYRRKDEGRTVVEDEDIIPGYRYGTTLVPFGKVDVEQLKYTCGVPGATLSVLGFTRNAYVPLSIRAGDQVMIISAKDGDEEGARALSSIIQALKELEMVAVTRKVYRKNLNPSLGVLYPDINDDFECLLWIGVPFQEEIRSFCFPSLERVMEKTTDEQKQLMDHLINRMDLTGKGDDDEELDPTMVVNPQIQHIFNCLTHRAINPNDLVLPPPQQHVLDLLSPPERQRQARDALAEKLKRHFPTQKIEKYKKKKIDIFANNQNDAMDAAANAGDATLASSDLTSVTVYKISTATPVQDFLAMLRGENPNYSNICSQMSDVLLQMVESMSGEAAVDRIIADKLIETLKTFREEAKNIDPSPFNTFIRDFKQVVMARKFSQLWLLITQDNMGLISQSETLKSKVTGDEVEQFLRLEDAAEVGPQVVQQEADIEDMLDDL